MKSPIFAIKDNLVGFNPPYVQQNERVAIREFRTMVCKLDERGEQSVFDLGLYHVGMFDSDSGVVESCDPQVVLLSTQILAAIPQEAGEYDD